MYSLDVFKLDTDTLPCTNLTKHTITLKSEKPINIKSYRPPECHKKEIERQVNDMLQKEIIGQPIQCTCLSRSEESKRIR